MNKNIVSCSEVDRENNTAVITFHVLLSAVEKFS
jgi:hypothetical protein